MLHEGKVIRVIGGDGDFAIGRGGVRLLVGIGQSRQLLGADLDAALALTDGSDEALPDLGGFFVDRA